MPDKLLILRAEEGPELDLYFLVPEHIWRQGGVYERAQVAVDTAKTSLLNAGKDPADHLEEYKKLLLDQMGSWGFVPPADVIKEGPWW